jgi:hypothetical protein
LEGGLVAVVVVVGEWMVSHGEPPPKQEQRA